MPLRTGLDFQEGCDIEEYSRKKTENGNRRKQSQYPALEMQVTVDGSLSTPLALAVEKYVIRALAGEQRHGGNQQSKCDQRHRDREYLAEKTEFPCVVNRVQASGDEQAQKYRLRCFVDRC